jgi:hypothetical protein
MARTINAHLHGGSLAEKTISLAEELSEVSVEDYSSGRLAIHRYVFHHSDSDGVRHYISDSLHPTKLS